MKGDLSLDATVLARDGAVERSDAEAIDDLLERALEAFENGEYVDADELLRCTAPARPHLLQSAERTVRLAASIVQARPLSAPSIYGYTIVGELGAGGMGVVYLAHQDKLGGRLVALKVLPPGIAASPRARRRFLSEVRSLAAVHHPHVVTIHDVVEQGTTCAYAMELIDGIDLGLLLERLAQLPHRPCMADVYEALGECELDDGLRLAAREEPYASWVARLGATVARALAAVHSSGTVHRDVKPSNILLRRDGTPLLADFGLARQDGATARTRAGEFIGTLGYAAPEQLNGEVEALDARADIYSLGATIYHALALRPPLRAGGVDVMLRAIEQRGIQPLRESDPCIPRTLERVVAKALSPLPSERQQSAVELAEELENAAVAGPFDRSVPSARHRRRALVGVVAGAALVPLAALFQARPKSPSPPEATAPASPLEESARLTYVGAWGTSDYFLTSQPVDVSTGRVMAGQVGGHLAVLNSREEFEAVRLLIGPRRRCWIGLSDEREEGRFEWENGEPVLFTHWLAGEPNDAQRDEDWTLINWGASGEWVDGCGRLAEFAVIEVERRQHRGG